MGNSLHFETAGYKFLVVPITSASLCTAFSHVATLHGDQLGIIGGFDPKRDCGWVILSMNLKLYDSMPASKTVRLETWIAAIEGALLIREFRITFVDGQGHRRLLAEAAQSFVLFDRTTRKIVLPPRAKRDELRGHERQLRFQLKILRRKSPANKLDLDPRMTAETRKTVSAKDVDQNGHLNNAVYLNWLSHWIDDEPGVRELAVEFLREATLDDSLQVLVGIGSGVRSFAFVDSVSGALAAEVQSVTSPKA